MGPQGRQPLVDTPISRRDLLRGALLSGAGLVGVSLLGCGSNDGQGSPTAVPTQPQHVTISAPNMSWQRLSPQGAVPSARSGHTLATDGQRVFLFGGRGPDPLGDFWIYNIAAGAWQEGPIDGAPGVRYGHGAVWDSMRRRMVIYGGQSPTGFFDDVWEFDPAAGQWQRVAPAGAGAGPAGRSGAAVVYTDDGLLLVSHGLSATGRLDDTWQLDLAAQTWTDVSPVAPRPIARDLVDGAWDVVKRRLLLFDGQSANEAFVDDLWGWSPEFGWQRIAREPHPSPRRQYSQVYDAKTDRAIFFAGQAKDRTQNDVWIYYVDGENWAQAAPEGSPPPPRFGHDAAIAADSSMFVFGGTNGTRLFDDFWMLSVVPAT